MVKPKDVQKNETTKKTRLKTVKPPPAVSESESESEEEKEDVMVSFKEEIKNILKEFKKDIKSDLKEFEKSLSFNCGKLDDIMKTINEIQNSMNLISKKQDILEQENVELKKRIKEMEQTDDDIQQYMRNKNIQIDGIPKVENENLEEIMKTIGNKLSINIKDEDIDAIHRLPTRSTKNPEPIVVQFLTRKMRDSIIMKGKMKENRINTKDLELKCIEKPVYINEHLTQKRKEILFEARKLKFQKEYKFLWTKGCKIFIRKTENSTAIQLQCLEDLSKIQ